MLHRNVNNVRNNNDNEHDIRGDQRTDQETANLRRVAVNAQVTAFLSVFEIVGFIVIFIITFVTSSKTTGQFLFRLLQYILMPVAFIINTEENKLQIVEHGWFNILLNTFNISNFCNRCKQANDVVPFEPDENPSNDDIVNTPERIAKNEDSQPNDNGTRTCNAHCNVNVPSD